MGNKMSYLLPKIGQNVGQMSYCNPEIGHRDFKTSYSCAEIGQKVKRSFRSHLFQLINHLLTSIDHLTVHVITDEEPEERTTQDDGISNPFLLGRKW